MNTVEVPLSSNAVLFDQNSTKEKTMVIDDRLYLKVKLISLAKEAKVIRGFERKGKVVARTESDVRPEPTVVDGHPFGTPKRLRTRYSFSPLRRDGLYRHRVDIVRVEARLTNIAYGFIRGKSYSQIETNATTPIDWTRVQKMVEQYGVSYHAALMDNNDMSGVDIPAAVKDQTKRFEEFKAEATAAIKASRKKAGL